MAKTLIAGLGNPGPKYSLNRHNVGFLVADQILQNLQSTPINKSNFRGELFKSRDIFVLKPTTFMNLSGESIAPVCSYYDIARVVVIYDEIDLPFGALRFKFGGGNNGHNGLKSIDSCIGDEYFRVRVGVGRPENKEDVAKYVLSDFSKEEKVALKEIVEDAANAALELSHSELNKIQERYTRKA
ncbi:MAG: aminoacyl-tRNA hydrolase [Campylobacterales bacterium]